MERIMKKIKISTVAAIAVYAMLVVVLSSCGKTGVTSKILNGDEQNLPDELKGMKIYSVLTDDGYRTKVAILNGKINSTTYQIDKTAVESTVIINNQNRNIIEVSQILVENDSLIVCRK